MASCIVIFDRQHYGKPGRRDVGAHYDIDRDGKKEVHEQEVHLTPLYSGPATEMLRARGHKVRHIDAGWYRTRHAEANALAWANRDVPVFYFAKHVNAGRGSYAAFIHDARSRGGRNLALELVTAFGEAGLPAAGHRALARAATSTNAWKRGFSTIQGIYSGPANICAVCFEPYFIDQPAHAELATVKGGKRIASALVVAVERAAAAMAA